MITRQEIIEIIKTENFEGLKVGNEQEGYIQLNEVETNEIFEKWADARLAKELAKAQVQTESIAKAALLEKLGITEEEAKLLLS